MKYREAVVSDIRQIQTIRRAVKENILSNPELVTNELCKEYLTERGKGWVCEIDKQIVGFAIADLKDNNIWALFLDPEFEGRGIGKHLHKLMLDWYFSKEKESMWLSTSPGTRADGFYRKLGWLETGTYGDGEIKLEMTRKDWLKRGGEFEPISGLQDL